LLLPNALGAGFEVTPPRERVVEVPPPEGVDEVGALAAVPWVVELFEELPHAGSDTQASPRSSAAPRRAAPARRGRRV